MKKLLIFLMSVFSITSVNADTEIYDDKIEQRRESLTLNKVIFVDHDLNRIELKTRNNKTISKHQTIKISLQKVGGRRSPTDTLEIWSVMKNHTDHDLQVEGRTMFFDRDEVPLDDQTAWKRMYIPANSFATYREYSISPEAAFYIVEIREGR